jgi:VanZ family protein
VPDRPSDADARRARVRRVALLAWALFIVYGSFIPFRFSVQPGLLHRSLERAEILPSPGARADISTPDVVSNVLLFVPLGFLVAAGGAATPAGARQRRTLVTAGALAAGLAIAIETGQLFAPGRTASLLDVAANVSGALVGAWIARRLAGAGGWPDPGRLVRDEPVVVAIALVVAAWAADAFYPFAVTLDVSTLAANFRRARWAPFHPGGWGTWPDLLVQRVLPGALLAALLRHLLGRRRGSTIGVAARAWAGTALLATALELGKLFVVGRRPDLGRAVLAAAGAVVGVAGVPPLARWWAARWRPAWALLLLATLLLVHAELTPFRFAGSLPAVASRARHVEWMPFRAYYRAEPEAALFDLWNKLLLSGFLGFAFRAATGRRPAGAAAVGLAAGTVLEAAQVAVVGRLPSVSDAIVVALAAWLGGAAHAWCRSAGAGVRGGAGPRREEGGAVAPRSAA